MFTSILKHISFLESHQIDGDVLTLRILPAFFAVSQTDPVLLIDISFVDPQHRFDSRQLEKTHREIIEAIDATESKVTLSLDVAGESIVFLGSVSWRYEDYSIQDLRSEIECIDAQTRDKNEEIRQLRRLVEGAVQFIEKSIDRSQRVQDLSNSPEHDTAKQVDLLRRVKRKLIDG